MFQKLEEVEKRYDELTEKISDPEVIARQSEWQKLMKEHSEITDIVAKYREYKNVKNAIMCPKNAIDIIFLYGKI